MDIFDIIEDTEIYRAIENYLPPMRGKAL